MRKPHYIRGLKTSQSINRCLFFDTETDQIQIDELTVRHDLNFGFCLYSRRTPAGKWSEPYYERFDSNPSFYDILENFTAPKTTLYCFCHNTNFDLSVLDLFNELPARGWKMKFACIEAPPTIIKFTKDKANIIFLDTLNFWPTTLAKIGKDLNLPKLDFPEGFNDREVADKYCMRDCEIIYKAVTIWADFLVDNDFGKFTNTMAGQAFQAYTHRFMPVKIGCHNNLKALEIERQAYSGGRSEPFRIGKFPGPWHQYDVNSMYPFVMSDQYYPSRLCYNKKYCNIECLKRLLEKHLLIADVTISTLDNAYPIKYEHKLIFPIGTFRTSLSTPELQLAIRTGAILKIHSVNVYTKELLFKSYVDIMYNLRLKAKETGDLVLSNQYKLLMNSLYGKFGQRGEVYDEFGRTEDLTCKKWEELDIDEGRRVKYRQFGGLIQHKLTEIESFNSMPAIAAHVTAYARMYLYHLLKVCGPGNTAYTDTDCLVTNNTGKSRMEKYLDDKELGKLKYEGTYKAITIYGPKDYEFDANIKHKGIKRSACWVSNSRAAQEQWSSLKGQLAAGKISEPTTRGIYKTLHRLYNKSVVMKSGKCRPFRFTSSSAGENANIDV